jgi:cation diffusion facilitator CzcD-associated flavoprotein CzcO
MTPPLPDRYDALVIGAGISGMYMLHRLRELGMTSRVFEAGTDVGGTWYWNRYPGARFDSESWSYGYSFSKELLEEWEWSEHFAAQPETLRYLQYVADKFDFRRDIEFRSRVKSAHYDEAANEWEIALESGKLARARYLLTGVGPLSVPVMPNIPGKEAFEGEAYHTGLWPHRPVDFANERVCIIGTGATGVQVIQEVAKTAAKLTIFQRTPNWCAPLNNSRIDAATQARLKKDLPGILAACLDKYAGFIHDADRRNTFDVSAEERERFYEELYAGPGFGIWMANFRDTMIDERANEELSRFIAKKIRSRVNDQALAEKLIPKDHGFGTRRVPLETNYYEVYNQSNVELVDIRETPIECITRTGVRVGGRDYDCDILIYATGFDAVTGALDRIDVRGAKGRVLKSQWADGPKTYLGMTAEGFPNFFAIGGPHNAANFCNIPRCLEVNVDWITDLLVHMREHGYAKASPTAEAVDEWTTHVLEGSKRMLLTKVRSWFMGMNTNVEGKQQPKLVLYVNGLPTYRKKLAECVAGGYAGFVFE